MADEPKPPPTPGKPPLPPGAPKFDQYYPGGVVKQMADLAGIPASQLDQYAPGGVMEPLRAAAHPQLVLRQHGPGAAVGQVGYSLVAKTYLGPTGATGPTGPTGATGPAPPDGPEPLSAALVGNKKQITITFNRQLDYTKTPAPLDFRTTVNNVPGAVAKTVTVNGARVLLVYALAINAVTLVVGYTPGETPLVDNDGIPAAPFSDFPVTL